MTTFGSNTEVVESLIPVTIQRNFKTIMKQGRNICSREANNEATPNQVSDISSSSLTNPLHKIVLLPLLGQKEML